MNDSTAPMERPNPAVLQECLDCPVLKVYRSLHFKHSLPLMSTRFLHTLALPRYRSNGTENGQHEHLWSRALPCR
jgi:hypothetical protein